jgi:hypothetical protein
MFGFIKPVLASGNCKYYLRRELGQKLVQARNSGLYASLRYDKLIVDNNVYKYEDLTRLRESDLHK